MAQDDNQTTEDRIKVLEDFKFRIELGQKWLLCAFGIVGALVAFLGSIITVFNEWKH